ncbi:15800_t:CDS:2 [Funneliformis geosporum]|nr:15800_t:CDS:2 [Funneliformis geosporum]
MKELVGEIEELKQAKSQLSTKNNELKESETSTKQKLTTSQTELTKLTTKLEEQAKILQAKEEELTNLQARPDITNEKYLKSQLTDKKELEIKLSETQKQSQTMEQQLKAVYQTYPVIMEEEKPENIKNYIGELEKRPTLEQLQQSIEQERDKYKDYVKLTSDEQAKLKTYENLKFEIGDLKKELDQKKTNNQEGIIKEISKLLTDTITPLRLEIKEWLTQPPTNNHQLNNSSTELPVDYKKIKTDKEELLKILEVLKLKILEEKEKN